MRTFLAVVALCVSLIDAVPRAQTLPTVRLIATGGTIANHPSGWLTAEELLRSVPTLDRYVTAEAEQLANVVSGALTLGDWLRLAQRINDLLAAPTAPAAVVVTTGTDTLEETAYFLNLTVRSDRPVVLTGAMRPPGSVGFDGAANLLDAFRVAADPTSRGRGVLVVANGKVNAARDVAKTDAARVDAFSSSDYGILGTVSPDRVAYERDVVRRHTLRSEFDVAQVEQLPRVDVLLTYQDAPGDLIRAAADRGAAGIVVAGAGAGATSGTQQDGIGYARSRGVMIVLATRAESGRVRPRPAGDLARGTDGVRRHNFIAADDLAPVKARILLMLALTQTKDPDEIQRMFAEY